MSNFTYRLWHGSTFFFIERNIDLIENFNYKDLYSKAKDEPFVYEYLGIVTQMLLDVDLFPQYKVGNTIPPYFLANADIDTFEIPSNIRKLGAFSFYSATINTLIIPENLLQINEGTFKDSNIPQIYLPNTCNYIGPLAFCNSKITYIKIPEAVKHLKKDTFYRCNNLTVDLHRNIESINQGVFSKCNKLIINYEGRVEDFLSICDIKKVFRGSTYKIICLDDVLQRGR